MSTKPKHASIGKPGTRATIVGAGETKGSATNDAPDADFLKGIDDDADVQRNIDRSISRELEGIAASICGITLRPLSMSEIMRLHEVNNEIMSGKKVGDMHNPAFSAVEFLYMMDADNDPDELARQAFGDPGEWKVHVSRWAVKVEPSDSMVTAVIDFINDATSTRVKSRLPKALQGGKNTEGNDSRRRGR